MRICTEKETHLLRETMAHLEMRLDSTTVPSSAPLGNRQPSLCEGSTNGTDWGLRGSVVKWAKGSDEPQLSRAGKRVVDL